MLRIAPFPALRPDPSLASRVAALPYDVVTTEEARALAAGNPHSFLRVSRAEIDLPPDTDPYAEAVYDRARENLDRLITDGVLLQDSTPRLYVYRLVRQGRAQVGLVCRCHVGDYEEGRIKRHELTRRDKEDDRTRHVLRLRANAGPVFLAFRDDATVAGLLAAVTAGEPLYHFDAVDGVTHTIWMVADPGPFIRAVGALPAAYIADGHHRAASAARAGRELRRLNPGAPDGAPCDWFLAALFTAGTLTILPYNRVVLDLNGRTPAGFLSRLAEIGSVTPTRDPCPDRPGVFCVYLAHAWHRVEIDRARIDPADPIRSLDVSLLQELVLEPILGVGDPRSDRRIDFVGGIHGTAGLAARVDSGTAAVAFSLHATTMSQLLDVADAGEIMPPKSTWFEPKLRSGLLVNRIE
ncbi:MAG: DUF1015 domain-containing protein [Phycisphaeraceae bacterium]|nr:DUF1015 domain-containing protein [Phycisphaeraceae bacterium]